MSADPLLAADPQRNAVVRASAGVGKTYLLVTRLVRLLLAGARPDAILAITFTRKAAAEMQTRLGERLLELAAADDEQLPRLLQHMGLRADASTLARARQLYETLLCAEQTVRATTFHAFCQDILRRFPLEADVPPGFELVETTALLVDEAWEALYSEASRQPDGELAQALEELMDTCNGLDNLRQALQQFLAHRSDWWAFCEQAPHPAAHAEAVLEQALGIGLEDDALAPLRQADAIAELTDFATLLGRHHSKSFQSAARALADALASGEAETLLEACRQALLTKDGKPRSYKASKSLQKSLGGEQALARFQQLHQNALARLQSVQEHVNAQQTLRRNRAWYRAGQALLEHYQRLKREQRLLDFADLEWKAYQLLRRDDNAQWVQYKLDQRIEHLLVDEFQDTNPTQWRLLLPLLEEMAQSDAQRPRSVFLVGDEKQSIYGFRRADPALFEHADTWLRRHMQAQAFPMSKSRRSASAIMDIVNQTFGQSSLGRLLGDFQPHQTFQEHLPGLVELLPLIPRPERPAKEEPPHELRNPLQQPRRQDTTSMDELEARQVAEKIRQLLAQGPPVGSGAQRHELTAGDIMVLMRSRKHAPHMERALREAGIPYLGMDRGTLLSSQEVDDVLALLNLLGMPFDNLALAQVLRSPIFGCGDEDLVRLAQAGQHGRDWLQRLAALAPELSATHPLRQAWQSLQAWRDLAGRLPVHDLLDHIIHQGQVIERYRAAYPPHLRQRAEANLGRLLELALEIDSGRYPSMGRFLAALKQLRQHGDEAPDEASPASQQAVRLLTIHAAKGLESPVVFLIGTGARPRSRSHYQALVNWPTAQARPSHFLLTGTRAGHDRLSRELLALQQQREWQESANLLYVAMTRARQRLYISAAEQAQEGESWYQALLQSWPRDEQDQPRILRSGTEEPGRPAPPSAPATVQNWPPYPRTPATPETATASIRPSQEQHDPEYDDPHARRRGLLIHRLLELLTQPRPPSRQAALHQLDFELGIGDSELLQACWEEATQLLKQPELAGIFDPAHFSRALNEVPIHYHDDHAGKPVHGIIDRLVFGQQGIHIVDYKTHAQARPEDLAALAEGYRQQLERYTEGVRRLWPGTRVRASLLFTRCAKLYPLPLEK